MKTVDRTFRPWRTASDHAAVGAQPSDQAAECATPPETVRLIALVAWAFVAENQAVEERFEELPDWTFSLHEQSAGVYVVLGKNRDGRSVRLVGEDPDELLSRCRESAAATAGATST